METSVFIGKIISVVYLAFGLGMLLNQNGYKKVLIELIENSSFLLFGGMLSVVTGMSIINFHNHWVEDWTVVITIIGWIALLKGFYLLVFPNRFAFFKRFLDSKILIRVLSLIAILFGLILGCFVFV